MKRPPARPFSTLFGDISAPATEQAPVTCAHPKTQRALNAALFAPRGTYDEVCVACGATVRATAATFAGAKP